MAAKNESTKTGTRLYCEKVGPITDDHVPPQGIFAKPHPDNLIKVPACKDCNGSFSQDDEYFRQKLVLNVEVYHHPATKQLADRVFRSVQRPQAKGMATAFFRDIRPVEVLTPSSLILYSDARMNHAVCSALIPLPYKRLRPTRKGDP